MEQWNSDEVDIEAEIERLREANRCRNISLNKIINLAFIRKYIPYSMKTVEEELPDGSTKVFVEQEDALSSQIEGKSLPKIVEEITILYADRGVEDFETFKTTSRRRIKRFLDTLLGQTNCVKRFFSSGFSQLQANDLIFILLHWDSGDFQKFFDEKYEEIGKLPPNSFDGFENIFGFENYIGDYVNHFTVGCLENQINLQKLLALWNQRLEIYYEQKKERLKECIKTELDSTEDLIWSCTGFGPEDEDKNAQLQFLNDCIQLIQELKGKICDASPHMQRLVATEEEEKIREPIRQHLHLKEENVN